MAVGTQDATPASVQGGQVVAEQGVSEQAPVGVPAGAGETVGGQAEFYGYTFPDGTKQAWKSRDELDKGFRDSYFREKDYYAKTRALADMRKELETRQSDMGKERENLARDKKEYEDFQWMIKNRPDVYEYLQTASRSPASPDVAYTKAQKHAEELSSKLETRLKELEERFLNQDLEKSRDSIYGELEKQFPDFDRMKNSDLLDEIGSGDLSKIARILYFADKGMRGTQATGKRLADTAQEKAAAMLTPATGTGQAQRKVPTNLDMAEQLAQKEWAGGRES